MGDNLTKPDTPKEAHPGLPPFIKDAVTVLYGIARDSLDLEWQARLIADAMGEMDPVDRIALGKKHPELMSALLKVEHYAACHRTEATYV